MDEINSNPSETNSNTDTNLNRNETNPNIETCRNMILSEDYIDLILNTGRQFSHLLPQEDLGCTEVINSRFAIYHYPINKIPDIASVVYNYRVLPKLYGLQDTTSMESAGIMRLRNLAGDRFRGKGVLIGFIDTGARVIEMLEIHLQLFITVL